MVGRITVVPRDPEVSPGDPETLQGLFGPFGPVTQSTSDVGAPAIEGGGAPGIRRRLRRRPAEPELRWV